MNDMRTHINRATGSSISMSEMRDRYGGSGAISFSDLYDTEGFVITVGSVTTKFGTDEGWSDNSFGSISPDEGDGRVQFAANSWLFGCYSPGVANTSAVIYIEPTSTSINFNGNQVTAGYKATDVTRVVLANTSRSITSQSSNATSSELYVTYNFPGSGTVHGLIKF